MKCVGSSRIILLISAAIALISVPAAGMSSHSLFAHQMLLDRATIHRVLFVPNDDVKQVLLGLIEAEKESVVASLYRLSDKDIIQALIDAHRRGVHVEVVVDHGCMLEKTQKISLLKKSGIPVHVHKTNYLMHNKFFLFSKNMYNKSIIWSGSVNCTAIGMKKNCENVIVWEHPNDFYLYRQQFERLKRESSVKRVKKNCCKKLW